MNPNPHVAAALAPRLRTRVMRPPQWESVSLTNPPNLSNMYCTPSQRIRVACAGGSQRFEIKLSALAPIPIPHPRAGPPVTGERGPGPSVAREIVGATESLRVGARKEQPPGEVYVHYFQNPWPDCFISIRTSSEATNLAVDPMTAWPRLGASPTSVGPEE